MDLPVSEPSLGLTSDFDSMMVEPLFGGFDSDDDNDLISKVLPENEGQPAGCSQTVPQELQRLKFEDKVLKWLVKNISTTTLLFGGLSEEAKAEAGVLRQGLEQIVKRKGKDEKLAEADLTGCKIVYVHVTELKHLSCQTKEIRRKQDPLFIIYGTNASKNLCLPDEIFPFGGILTLTAQAIIENLSRLDEIIEIAAHPLWEVFLLPSVVGLAKKQYYGQAW
ncbi:hypothetical protein GYMLUDRAFT_79402, partial [Collybiopsis luxurians FD-317 M1]